ncbi:hypothetical protein Tsp_07011, partial [Trichinella spiralis]
SNCDSPVVHHFQQILQISIHLCKTLRKTTTQYPFFQCCTIN